MNYRIPAEVKMEEVGHEPDTAMAISPNYTLEDMGENYNLTITVMGHELDEAAALLVLNNLSIYLSNLHTHKELQAKK